MNKRQIPALAENLPQTKLIEEVLPPYALPVKCQVIQDEIHKAVLSYSK